MARPKRWRFWFHYNRRLGKISLRYRGKCHMVDDVACRPTCFSKWNKRQPLLVMVGKASQVAFDHSRRGVLAVICA